MRSTIEALIRIARRAYANGSLPATSGNFSARISTDAVLITASGRDKGELCADSFGTVDLDGVPKTAAFTPSAEVALHCALYRRGPGVGAVLHTHSVVSTILSRKCRGRGELRLEGYEIAKAFEGHVTHATPLIIPIFEATQDMLGLARAVDGRGSTNVPAYLVEGHGMTTWGTDVESAGRHLEAMEFLLACAWEEMKMK